MIMNSVIIQRLLLVIVVAIVFLPEIAIGQSAKPTTQNEWDKTVELAKKEGKVVVSIPASTELRAVIEKLFEQRFGIDVEPVVGHASAVVRKMVDESKAGVRYVDLHMGGSESVVTGLLPEGVLEPFEQFYKRENQSEEKINRLREPAVALARKLLG